MSCLTLGENPDVIRRTIATSAIVALTLGMAPAATAAPGQSSPLSPPELEQATAQVAGTSEKGTVLSLGERSGRELYLVQLEDAAVPAYTGGVEGLRAVQAEGRSYDATAARERAYRGHLEAEQADLERQIRDLTGRAPQIRFRYTDAVNGIAVRLTSAEAQRVAGLAGVAAVQVDEERELQTDVGPEWIGAPSIWDGTATPDGTGTEGQGVVVGVLDSGINPANPSFAADVPAVEGHDAYVVENPREGYYGVCDEGSAVFIADWGCNDKLIGAWDFAPGDGTNPYDEDGHGTHTASTSAGNWVEATTYSTEADPAERFEATRVIKGVAPRANVIAYDVCAGGCPLTAIVAGIDQAIADEVDVINYSIGSAAASNPWTDADALGFLNARAAGIDVATSAGNAGPGAATVGSPADVPWITSVGATQHNRQWQASVEDITADGGASHPDIDGLAFANPTDQAYPLVDAADLGSPLCLAGELAGEDLTGQIVVCQRGSTGRVEKGQVVAALGAEGMVLANDEASGDSLNADPHALPAVHITYADGVELREWMAGVEGEQASLSGGQEHIGDDVADIVAGFSSRGPNRAVELVSPSISAPGVDILAGNGTDNEVSWGFISGTSMASPHVAGSMALVSAANPDWTPAEVQSALMTTSFTDVTDTDGSDADWFDMGSGRADLTKAADAGLVLDETEADYLAADPTLGGDVKELNTASMASSQCLEECTWTRTVTGTSTGSGEWTATGAAVSDGISVTVEPATFSLAEGETQEITVTADVAGAPTDDYLFGTVVLTPAAGSDAPEAHLPVAVLPSTGVIPTAIDIDTRRDAGSQESDPIEAVEITDLDIEANGLVRADSEELAIPQDTTNTDPFDGNGTEVVEVTVPEGATRFVATLQNATAPDFDLFVGTGEVSDENVVCSSASGGSAESCDFPLDEADAGEWWVLVQNWEASSPSATDTVDLETAVVGGDAGNLRAEGPATQPAGEPFTIRTFWDEPRMRAGQTWYGSLSLSSAPGGTDIGTIPVTVNRFEDDVTKSVDRDRAEPGDTLTYTVEVQPNVTPEDLTYTFRDRLPQGTTYVEGSGPEGATVQNGVLTWEHTMLSPAGAEGSYDITTSAQDEDCVNPWSGDASYLDLHEFGDFRDASVEGDGTAWTFAGGSEFGFYEETFPGLTITDDGFLVYDADNYAGDPGTPQSLPDPALPNNVAAFLWQDMQVVYEAGTQAGVSLVNLGGGVASMAQFDDLRLADDPSGEQGLYDVQVLQFAGDRDVFVTYGPTTGPVDGVTIGTEDAEGDRGTSLVDAGDASAVVVEDTVVCMAYAGPDLDSQTFTYQVTVDDDVREGTDLVNVLTHTVDNPGSKRDQEVTVTTLDGGVAAPAVKVRTLRDAREPNKDGRVVFVRPRSAVGERLTVEYDLGGNAVRGRDFRGLNGVVTFPRDRRRVGQNVRVVNRPGNQGVRRLRISLVEGADYVVGDPASTVVKIRDARRRR